MPVRYWAILPASNAVIEPFSPPDFESVTVYEPVPNPVSEYVPDAVVVSDNGGEPAALTSTPGTPRGLAPVTEFP